MPKRKIYRLVVDEPTVLLHPDLKPVEVRAAIALGRGLLGELKLTDSTRNRTLSALEDKGIVAEVTEEDQAPPLPDPPEPKDPGMAWLTGHKFNDLTEEEGGAEFGEYNNNEIKAMGRNGRFQVFCQSYGADGNDPAVRSAWVKLESENSRKDGDRMPEIVYLFSQIIHAAQHEASWCRRGLRQPTPADQWLKSARYDHEEYNVQAGEDPLPILDDGVYQARANRAAEQLVALDVEFEPPHQFEAPLASARRLEAVLRQAQKMKAMS